MRNIVWGLLIYVAVSIAWAMEVIVTQSEIIHDLKMELLKRGKGNV